MPQGIKYPLYVVWFFFIFFVAVYWTLPLGSVKNLIAEQMEIGLGKGDTTKVGTHGTDPEVMIGDVSLYRFTGLSMEKVQMRLASKNKDPGALIELDEVNARVGFLSLLTDSKSVSFRGELYDRSEHGGVEIKRWTQKLESLDVEIDGVNLMKVDALQDAFQPSSTSTPEDGEAVSHRGLEGVLEADVDLTLGADPSKDSDGDIALNITKASIGPSDRLTIPGVPLPIDIPLIDLGALDIDIGVTKGKLASRTFTLSGGNVNGEAEIEAKVAKKFGATRINGSGSIKIDDAFINAKENASLKTKIDMASQFAGKAKAEDGSFLFNLAGTLQKPRFVKSRGKKKK